MKKGLFAFVTTVIFICLTQISASAKSVYSLFDLAKIASEQSQTIKIAQDDLEIAELEKKRALSVLTPTGSVYGSMTERKDADMQNPDTFTLGAKLTQSFTINGKELIALKITKDSIQGKTYSLEAIRSEYMLSVAQAYYDILSAERYLEISQSEVDRLTTYRDSVKEKLEVGKVAKTDFFRAEAELSKSKTQQIIAENSILKAKAALMNLVTIDGDFELEKTPIPQVKNYTASLENILEKAEMNRSEIKEAQKNLAIAEKTIRYNRSDYWPSFSIEAGYKDTDIEYRSSDGDVDYDTEDLYVSGTLSFTFFDGGLRSATIRQAMAEHRKAKNALELQKKAIHLESKTAYYDFQSAKSALINLEDELRSAEETYNAVNMQIEYGMANSIDAMDANSLLVSAERSISDAEYTLYYSVLRILYTKGELNEFLAEQQ